MKKLRVFDEVSKQLLEFEVEDHEFEVILKGDTKLAETLTNRFKERQNYVAAYSICRESSNKSYSNSCGNSDEDSLNLNHAENNTYNAVPACREVPYDIQLTDNYLEDQENNASNTRIWTSERTLLLISLVKKYDKKFDTTLKKILWKKISDEMTLQSGLPISAQQCDTKWKGLKNLYKNIKKHNATSGNEPKFWEFFDSINEILHQKPEISPVAVCSSRDGLVTNGSEVTGSSTAITPKRTASSESLVYSVLKRKIENSTERHHKEKMDRQDQFLNLFERMTNAVENISQRNDNN